MIYALGGLNVLLTLGYLFAGRMVLAHLRERDQSERLERATLLQRIQAPQEAVFEHSLADAATRPDAGASMPPVQSDEEFWEQEYARRETLDRIHAIEVNGLGSIVPGAVE